jgi:hypothetical protein
MWYDGGADAGGSVPRADNAIGDAYDTDFLKSSGAGCDPRRARH